MTGPGFLPTHMKVLNLTARPASVGTADVDAFLTKLCAEHSHGEDPLLAALAHHLGGGGSRTRAHICLRTSLALGLTDDVAVCLATAVECLHNASLVQDDLQDKSPLRRGKSAVWKFYGNDTALCLTDLLLSSAYAALGSLPPTDQLRQLIGHIHTSVSKTLRGQMKDTQAITSETNRLDASLKTAVAKSGPFFVSALELPLIASGAQDYLPSAQVAAEHFGMGYQIYDDIVDFQQDKQEGNQHNVVGVLAKSNETATAVRRAAHMARWQLRAACQSASLLPRGSGDALAKQAEKVIEKVNAFIG